MKLKLITPKTNKAEILYTLIEKGSVSIKDFPYLSGFRTRISELINDDQIPLSHTTLSDTNKFGNSYYYKSHILSAQDKDLAIERYKSINQN